MRTTALQRSKMRTHNVSDEELSASGYAIEDEESLVGNHDQSYGNSSDYDYDSDSSTEDSG